MANSATATADNAFNQFALNANNQSLNQSLANLLPLRNAAAANQTNNQTINQTANQSFNQFPLSLNTLQATQLFQMPAMNQSINQSLANQTIANQSLNRQMQQALYQMSMMPLNMNQLNMQQAMSMLPYQSINQSLPTGLWGSAFPSLHASPISTPAPSSPSSPTNKLTDWADRVNAQIKMHAQSNTEFANIDPELISDDIKTSPTRVKRKRHSNHHSNESTNHDDPESSLNNLYQSLRRSLTACEEVITHNPSASTDFALSELKGQLQSMVDKIGSTRKRKHDNSDGDSPARQRVKLDNDLGEDDEDNDDGGDDDDELGRGGCKPCPLLESVPKKPIKVLYVNVQAQFTVSKKDTQKMSREDKERLVPVHVRIMGSQSKDEIYFVAKDVCLLIHTRKGNVAKSIGQFKEDEKVRMSVICPRSNGTVSTHILTALTVKGVKRLLSTSRSPLAPHVLKWIQKQIDIIHQEWNDKSDKPAEETDQALNLAEDHSDAASTTETISQSTNQSTSQTAQKESNSDSASEASEQPGQHLPIVTLPNAITNTA